jgi:hypothetical protein
MALGGRPSQERVSRSMRVGSRDNRSEHGQRVSLNFRRGLPLRRNKRLRRLSRSPAAEFSARQAQRPSLVLHDLLWTQKLKLSRSTRTASGPIKELEAPGSQKLLV